AACGGGIPLGNPDQPFRMGVGQRLQQHGLDHAEHRGVDADADRQRGGGDERERAVLEEQPERVPKVLCRLVNPTCPPSIAAFLFHLLESAELGEGATTSLALGHAVSEVGFYLLFAVEAKLRVQFAFQAMPLHEALPPFHAVSPSAARRKKAIFLDKRVQLAVSALN